MRNSCEWGVDGMSFRFFSHILFILCETNEICSSNCLNPCSQKKSNLTSISTFKPDTLNLSFDTSHPIDLKFFRISIKQLISIQSCLIIEWTIDCRNCWFSLSNCSIAKSAKKKLVFKKKKILSELTNVK